jgi:hypothetical protein
MALGETRVHFCTPDDALVVRNILSFYLSQFVKPPSDTLLRYCDILFVTVTNFCLENISKPARPDRNIFERE